MGTYPVRPACSTDCSGKYVHHQLTDNSRTAQVPQKLEGAKWFNVIVNHYHCFTLVIILYVLPLIVVNTHPGSSRSGCPAFRHHHRGSNTRTRIALHQLTNNLRTPHVPQKSEGAKWFNVVASHCHSFTLVIILHVLSLASSHFSPTRTHQELDSRHFVTTIETRNPGQGVPIKLVCSSNGSGRTVHHHVTNN